LNSENYRDLFFVRFDPVWCGEIKATAEAVTLT
jgi:hypothetical protein